jgi:hypothetical protein
MAVSNLGRGTGYAEWGLLFSSVPAGKCMGSALNVVLKYSFYFMSIKIKSCHLKF